MTLPLADVIFMNVIVGFEISDIYKNVYFISNYLKKVQHDESLYGWLKL